MRDQILQQVAAARFHGHHTAAAAWDSLTPDELAALDALDRRDKLKRGPKDPGTDVESVVCLRWLMERDGWSGPDAHSLLAEMTGTTARAIKERQARAKGLGRNIADRTFDIHAQKDMPPALLRHRAAKGRCLSGEKVKCRCDPAPRPAFLDTPEGATAAALLSFWSMHIPFGQVR